VRMVLSRVALMVGLGIIGGTAVILWLSKLIATLLYVLQPRDPVTLAGGALILAAIGALAGWLPARRASRIDPLEVLRNN
jgi:putative ABC transport system permease protein